MVENIGDLALSQDDVNCINTLALAYIGDCIWEIYVRNYVLSKN